MQARAWVILALARSGLGSTGLFPLQATKALLTIEILDPKALVPSFFLPRSGSVVIEVIIYYSRRERWMILR